MRRNKRFSVAIVAVCMALSMTLSGCWYLVIGGVAAAGGYAVSRDTIQGETDKSFDETWQAAKDVLTIMGTIESESYELGEITAIVSGARVWVNVIQLTATAVRIKVKARKALFPSIATAQNVYLKIVNRVNGEI